MQLILRIENIKKAPVIFYLLTILVLLPTAIVWSDTSGLKKEDKETIRIPLKISNDPNDKGEKGWKAVEFPDIPPNQVSWDKDGLHIKMRHSASLLVYRLSQEIKVNNIFLRGTTTGLPKIPEGQMQGDEKADDFAMRLGLVVSGKKKLGPLEKRFAPELVKSLYELIPSSQGLDHILFLNLANDPPPKWRKRAHPIGKGYLREHIVCTKKEAGDFKLQVKFEKPLTVFALCFCCDGDHTKSKYDVTINDIQLKSQKRDINGGTNL